MFFIKMIWWFQPKSKKIILLFKPIVVLEFKVKKLLHTQGGYGALFPTYKSNLSAKLLTGIMPLTLKIGAINSGRRAYLNTNFSTEIIIVRLEEE